MQLLIDHAPRIDNAFHAVGTLNKLTAGTHGLQISPAWSHESILAAAIEYGKLRDAEEQRAADAKQVALI